MSLVPLPTSFVECIVLVALGWVATTAQVALLRPTVTEAAEELVSRITFPAFIFQSLATGGVLLGHSAKVTVAATVIHMLLSFAIGWYITRGQNQRQQALLAALALGYETEGWAAAWCSVVWGFAGAQAAALVACTTAVLYPVFTLAAGSMASMGVPAELKHAGGGLYTGEWNRAVKEGLGIYRYQNGAMYEGWWKNNVKHGLGVYHYADGGRFEGEFANGVRNGIGIRIWPHGAVKAALFEHNKRVRDVDLTDAAHVMQAASEAAAMAHYVKSTRSTPAEVAKRSLLNGPVIAVGMFVLAVLSSVPVAEPIEMVLSTAASVHIPLSLILLGASIPNSLPEKRSAPQVRTVIATRLLPALAVAAGVLMCATQSNEHAIRSAAVAGCLLSPVSSQVFDLLHVYAHVFRSSKPLISCIYLRLHLVVLQALQQAKEWKLSPSLVDGVAVASLFLSCLCMGLFSVQAWAKDVVPVCAMMTTVSIGTFALVDHCIIQLAVLAAMAYFFPRIFLRRFVKMTLTAKSAYKDPPNHGLTSVKPQSGSATALSMARIGNKAQWRHPTVHGNFRSARQRVPRRMTTPSCTQTRVQPVRKI